MNRAIWLATTKPKVQAPRRATSCSASSCRFQRQRNSRRLAWRRLGMRETPWNTTPSEVPRPSRTSWPRCCSTEAREAPWPAQSPNHTRMPMHTMLLTIGAHATATKRRRGIEQCRTEREEPVRGDLDDEPAQERRGDLPLQRDAVQLVRVAVGVERGQGVDEVRRRHERGDRGGQEDDHRDRDHRRDGFEGLLLAAFGQPLDEDGDERRREDPAEHDVVEHVGRRVGQVVGVGEGRLTQGPGQRDEAEQAGDPGHAGADGDVRRGRAQRKGAGPAGCGHVSGPGGAGGGPAARCVPTRR